MDFNQYYLSQSNPRHFLSLTGMILISCIVLQCAHYSFSGSMAPHIKTVAVPLFEDNTAEFNVKEQFTDVLIEEFTRDNTLKIADRRRADSVLEGVIFRIEDRAGAYNSQESAQEMKVYVTVDIRYFDRKKNEVIWEDRLTQWGTYDPGMSGDEARMEGITEALDKLATEILNRTVSGW